MKLYFRGYHWPHILFFSLTPVAAIVGTGWVISNGGPHAATWILAGVMFVLCGLSVTSGYHRLFTHSSYEASWPVRLFYIIFGGAAFEGSVRWWACEHRYHHRYTDTQMDPYGINKGFWYAHIGWLFTKDQEPPCYDNVKDLDQDWIIRFQDRFYPLLAVVTGFGIPVLIASLWGDPWGGFFVAGLLRMVLNHHATFCINSVCHYVGKQTYSDKHSARDSWLAALLTFGEGYHNFHHEFQYDYRNGIRIGHWDPTKWFIRLLAWMGFAKGLQEADREKILEARLRMEQKCVTHRLSLSIYSETARLKAQEVLNSAAQQLHQAYVRFQQLKEEYRQLQRDRLHLLSVSIDERREELRRAQQEFQFALSRWRDLIRGPIPVEV